MARQGFTYVKEKGFISLLPDLREGLRWKTIDDSSYQDAQTPPPKPIHKQPFPLYAKVRMIRAILGLLAARGLGTLDIVDAAWDKIQRRFFHLLSLLLLDDDPQKQAAAQKLLSDKALFLGNGTAQTILPVSQERDFGRQQVVLLRGIYAPQAATLSLSSTILDIEKTTEDLSNALGLGLTQVATDAASRREQSRAAEKECRQACNFAYGGLAYPLAKGALSPEDRQETEELLAPLTALLARYAISQDDQSKEEDIEEDDTDAPAV